MHTYECWQVYAIIKCQPITVPYNQFFSEYPYRLSTYIIGSILCKCILPINNVMDCEFMIMHSYIPNI